MSEFRWFGSRRFISGAVCVTVLALSPVAHAQVFADTDDSRWLTAGLSLTGITLVAAGVVTVPLTLTTLYAGEDASEEEATVLEAYLRANEQGLREATALGSGEVFDDFSKAFGLDDTSRAAFARVLRRERDELLELARPDLLDRERARLFIEVLSSAMRGDAILAGAVERRADG